MARRSFSLMLAWRYLNPRRAMLSAVAMISVAGVMLGVLVLVVVMSVYSGLERDVKERFLGFIPHIRLDSAYQESITDWREIADSVAKMPEVEEAGPYIQDSMLIDIQGYRRPGIFRAIDTSNPTEVEGIESMLDLNDHPDSTADMGIDERVVISSKIADAFNAKVGYEINLLTLRNLEQVEAAYEKARQPLVRETYAEQIAAIRKTVAEKWKVEGTLSRLPTDDWNAIVNSLSAIADSDIHIEERDIIHESYEVLNAAEDEKKTRSQIMTADAPQRFLTSLARLDAADEKELKLDTLMSIEEYVLPKTATIVGVYQASQMALTPDVFVPLHMGQELAGLGDNVQAVSVRLEDPYKAAVVAEQMVNELPAGWYPVTWFDQMAEFSRLIEQQRVMMYFALSFIILVSAFSMTAVMFTVTIQKRCEIGVMKALGAAPSQIVKVFVYQGMILGAAGSVIGVGLGLVVIHYREYLQMVLRNLGFDPFPKNFSGFNVLPAHINPVELAVIGVSAFLLCSVAALIPAFFASRSDAARSLRNL